MTDEREDRALDSATSVLHNALPYLTFVPGRPDSRTRVSSGGPPGKVMDAGWKSRPQVLVMDMQDRAPPAGLKGAQSIESH